MQSKKLVYGWERGLDGLGNQRLRFERRYLFALKTIKGLRATDCWVRAARYESLHVLLCCSRVVETRSIHLVLSLRQPKPGIRGAEVFYDSFPRAADMSN